MATDNVSTKPPAKSEVNNLISGRIVQSEGSVEHDSVLHEKLVDAIYIGKKEVDAAKAAAKIAASKIEAVEEATAKLIKDAPTEQLFSQSINGMNILHVAIQAGDKKTSAALIKKGTPDQVFIQDRIATKSGLDYAISMNDKETALSLVNKEGVTEKHLSKGKNGNSYLGAAIDKKMDEVTAAIAKKLPTKNLMPYAGNAIVSDILINERKVKLGNEHFKGAEAESLVKIPEQGKSLQ